MEIIDTLEKERIRRGISARTLSRQMHYHEGHISAEVGFIRRGEKQDIMIGTLALWADALGYEITLARKKQTET